MLVSTRRSLKNGIKSQMSDMLLSLLSSFFLLFEGLEEGGLVRNIFWKDFFEAGMKIFWRILGGYENFSRFREKSSHPLPPIKSVHPLICILLSCFI